MALNLKKFAQSSAIYGVLNALPGASKFVLFPIFVHYLSPADYGILGLNGSIVAGLTIVMAFGFDAAFSRLFFDYQQKKELINAYLSTIMLLIICIGLLFAAVIYPFGDAIFRLTFEDPSYTFQPYGMIALAMAFATSVNAVVKSYFRNRKQPGYYFLVVAGTFTIITIFESLAILVYDQKAEGVLLARLVGLLSASIITWLALFYKTGLKFETRFLRPSLKFGLPLIPYSVVGFVYFYYDRVLIENYLSLDELGIYNVAFTIAFVIELAIQSIQSATFPNIYELLKQNYNKHIGDVNLIFRLLGLATIVLIALVLVATPVFLHTFTRPEYHRALYLIPILAAGFIFRYLFVVYTLPLFFLKKTKQVIWLNVVAGIITVVGNVILLPRIGLMGAPITMFAARFGQILLTVWLTSKLTQFPFQLKYIYPSIGLLMIISLGLSGFYWFPANDLMLWLFGLPLFFIIIASFAFMARKGVTLREKGFRGLIQYL